MLMCNVLNVSRSGYYDWLKSNLSKLATANTRLNDKISCIFNEHKMRYGAPRITKVLKNLDETYSSNRVALRMQAIGLKAVAKRKLKVTTDSEHTKLIYSNVLNHDFNTTGVNQKWCSD